MFPVQLTMSRIGNLTRLIHTSAIYDDHAYVHTGLAGFDYRFMMA